MTTIAVSLFGDRVSGRLDCSDTFLVVSVQDGAIHNRRTISTPPETARRILEHLGVDILICGGVTERCLRVFQGSHIRVIPWVLGDAELVLAAFLENHTAILTHEEQDGVS